MKRILQTILMGLRPAYAASFLKQLLNVTRMPVTVAEGTFFVDPISFLGKALCRHGIYERETCDVINKFIKPGDVYVDLGANEGFLTVYGARRCGPSGRIIAIEPQHRILPIIEKNLSLNGITNVTILNAAITDQEGVAHIHLTPDINSGSSGLHRIAKYSLPTQSIRTLTLEQAFEELKVPHVDFMKVDIEGFEYEAILGAKALLRDRRIKVIALDLHPEILKSRGKAAADIERCLADAGYNLTTPFGKTVWIAPS